MWFHGVQTLSVAVAVGFIDALRGVRQNGCPSCLIYLDKRLSEPRDSAAKGARLHKRSYYEPDYASAPLTSVRPQELMTVVGDHAGLMPPFCGRMEPEIRDSCSAGSAVPMIGGIGVIDPLLHR